MIGEADPSDRTSTLPFVRDLPLADHPAIDLIVTLSSIHVTLSPGQSTGAFGVRDAGDRMRNPTNGTTKPHGAK
jgi:hypothetical protein